MTVNYSNLGISLPSPGEQANTWGGSLNTAFGQIDAVFAAAGNGTPVGLHVAASKYLIVGPGGYLVTQTGSPPAVVSLQGTVNIYTPTVDSASFTGVTHFQGGGYIDPASNVVMPRFTGGAFVGDGSGLSNVNYFPSGTVMLFAQSHAPPGWTTIGYAHDRCLRVVSSEGLWGGGVAGGTVPVSAMGASGTDSHQLSTAEIPAHQHHGQTGFMDRANPHSHSITAVPIQSVGATPTGGLAAYWNTATAGNTDTADINHLHPFDTNVDGGGNGVHAHGLSATKIQYADVLTCSKD